MQSGLQLCAEPFLVFYNEFQYVQKNIVLSGSFSISCNLKIKLISFIMMYISFVDVLYCDTLQVQYQQLTLLFLCFGESQRKTHTFTSRFQNSQDFIYSRTKNRIQSFRNNLYIKTSLYLQTYFCTLEPAIVVIEFVHNDSLN